MDKRTKTIAYIALITAAEVILPTLAALVTHGFSVNTFVISDYIFTFGIFTLVAGGVLNIIPFFQLKAKIRKVRFGEPIEVKKREGLRWEYMLLSAGVVVIAIAYFIAVI